MQLKSLIFINILILSSIHSAIAAPQKLDSHSLEQAQEKIYDLQSCAFVSVDSDHENEENQTPLYLYEYQCLAKKTSELRAFLNSKEKTALLLNLQLNKVIDACLDHVVEVPYEGNDKNNPYCKYGPVKFHITRLLKTLDQAQRNLKK